MLTLLKPLWLKIAQWGAIIGGIALVLLKVRQSGKEAVENKDIKDTLHGIQIRDKVEGDINALSDSDFAKLHDEWTQSK